MLPITHDKIKIDADHRIDSLVEDTVITEHKTVEKIMPVHDVHLLTYLQLKRCKLGFLLNGNVPRTKNDIKRMVNEL